jgi:hypothetical protein
MRNGRSEGEGDGEVGMERWRDGGMMERWRDDGEMMRDGDGAMEVEIRKERGEREGERSP